MNGTEKLNILLVDDQPKNLLALQAMLEPLGQNIVTAHSGTDALRRVLDHDFAVILLDVQMPGMDGFETARLLRQRERSRHTPIIFATATVGAMGVAHGYAAGAVDYLVKPIAPEFLLAKVQVFLDLAAVRRQLEAEIAERQRAEREILQLTETLEQHVRERTAELELERAKLAAAFANMPLGIVLSSAQGDDLVMNAAAERMHGFASRADMHARVADYAQEWELRDAAGRLLPFAEWPLPRAIAGDFVRDCEIHLHNLKSGYEWDCSYTAVPVRDRAGVVSLIVLTLLDITARNHATREIRALNTSLERRVAERTRQLEAANKELDAFNQTMVGREQRIIEMKEEVNALCRELGRAPEYPPVWRKET